MKMRNTVRFETMAVHAAADPDPRTGALAAAIQMSTTFERAADGTFPSGFAYTRDANPNRTVNHGLSKVNTDQKHNQYSSCFFCEISVPSVVVRKNSN